MKTFLQLLKEGKQVGILYHYSSIESLIKIAKTNMLKPMGYKGVSFTRDKHFHKVEDRADETVRLECRFIVDGDKLSTRYKIKPFNYFGQQSEFPQDLTKYYKHTPRVDEQEELVKDTIRDLNKYVIKVQIVATELTDNYECGWLSDKYSEQFPTEEDLLAFLRSKFEVELI